MKKNLFNQKNIIIILVILLIISAVVIAFLLARESKNSESSGNSSSYQNDTAEIIESTTTTTTSTTIKKDNDTNVTTNTTVKYSAKDETVIEEVKSVEEAADEILKNDSSETAKSKLKGIFISLVDFLFYDGEIKGVTFNELTESGKTKVLQIIHSIDEKIEKKFPGYKEDISSAASSAFKKASELIKKGAQNLSEFSQDKLGEENYNAIIESKDDLVSYTKAAYSIIKEVGGNFFSKTKDKLKNWYEKFRDE